MQEINWNDFEKVELRVGKIVEAKDFPEARKPAYILSVDFGDKIGIKKSSAQVTHLYTKEDLIGKQIIGVVNFPTKQIGPFMSECLITGFTQKDGSVILAVPEREAALGSKLG
jgi:tRNA-binding protein